MSGLEIIHKAGPDGQTCALCGRAIAPDHFRYRPGALVAVVDGDSGGSFLSQRKTATCPKLVIPRGARP